MLDPLVFPRWSAYRVKDGQLSKPGDIYVVHSADTETRGEIVNVSGDRITKPLGVDGKPAGDQSPRPVLPVSVSGIAAELLYAGGAPGQVAGVLQLNVRIPADLVPGDASTELSVDRYTRQPGVTIAVR